MHLACQNQRAHGWMVAPGHITIAFKIARNVSHFSAHIGGNTFKEGSLSW